jgi:hypothetical protein
MKGEVPMKALLILFTAAAATWAQSNGALRARELFYTPPPATGSAASTPGVQAPASPPSATQAAATAAPKQVAKKAPAKQNPSGSQVASGSKPVPTQNVTDKPEAIPLGMRYSVLKRDASGKYAEVDPESTFHSGDRIRLEVQSNSTGYLYVVAQGSSGNWQVLFPANQVANGSNLVHRSETRQVPGGNAGQFVFDEQAGTEKLFFILTRQPERNIDRVIYSVGGQGAPADTAKPDSAKPDPSRVLMAQASIGDDVISQIRSQMRSRDLIFEKVDGARVEAQVVPPSGAAAASNNGVKFETAAYVVNPSTAPDARLVVDVKLTHQ